jgi:hypothetical protein
MESIRISNEIHILAGRRAIDNHMACFSALFSCHVGIVHFEVVETQIFKFLHEKINLGCEHNDLFKLVNLAGAGLRSFISPNLSRSHLFNKCPNFLNTEIKE